MSFRQHRLMKANVLCLKSHLKTAVRAQLMYSQALVRSTEPLEMLPLLLADQTKLTHKRQDVSGDILQQNSNKTWHVLDIQVLFPRDWTQLCITNRDLQLSLTKVVKQNFNNKTYQGWWLRIREKVSKRKGDEATHPTIHPPMKVCNQRKEWE